jgi:hypothetical protein
MSCISLSPLIGEPVLAPSTQRVASRHGAVVQAIGALIDNQAAERNGLLTGCAVAPDASLVIAATALNRPLRYPECNLIAQASRSDMILLRFDADRGASFDILLRDRKVWLCRHLAWRRRDGHLWLIPTAGDGPCVQATGWGLHCEPTPPYVSNAEREAGIIPALDTPSFEGRI